MKEQTTGSDRTLGERKRQLNAMQIQLRSQRASDILRGMTQVRKWLQENPEDGQVYEILLDAVQENHNIREKVRDLFLEMIQKGSKGAEEALSVLPSTPTDLLTDADDAYYAAEYSRAIQLYIQVLKRVPDHERAKEYLAKAKSAQQDAGEMILGLPREAVQYYRRARSYLAAGDFMMAIKTLSAAVETAQARGVPYSDAEELLKAAQESLIADEYKQKANLAVEKEQWTEAFGCIKKGLALNLADIAIKKELSSLEDLLRAELNLRKFGAFKVFAPLGQLRTVQKTAEKVVNPDNLLLNMVSKQLNRLTAVRIALVLLIVLIGGSLWVSQMDFSGIPSAFGPAASSTLTVTPTLRSPTSPVMPTATGTITYTPTTTPTQTLTPIPTEVPVLGYGKLTEYRYPLVKPDGDILGVQLTPKQYVTIIDRLEVKGVIWYKCQWEIEGIGSEGWIQEQYIQFAPPPTPTP